jgi:hypothetical protein
LIRKVEKTAEEKKPDLGKVKTFKGPGGRAAQDAFGIAYSVSLQDFQMLRLWTRYCETS